MTLRTPNTKLMTAETAVWLLLVAMTVVSWTIAAFTGSNDGGGATNLSLILIAFIKVRFIMLYFMEVRHGPFLLRLSCEAWLAIAALGLIAFLFGWL